MVRIYGIKNCSTMKKAFDWLEQNGVAFVFTDYKDAQVLEERLPEWLKKIGLDALINRRGLTWKKLTEKQRAVVESMLDLATLSAAEQKAIQVLLLEHPTLIKRPVLESGRLAQVGFDPGSYQALVKDGRPA